MTEEKTLLTHLGYGSLSDGSIVHISQVVCGLGCNCKCIGCKKPLIAKKGDVNIHHFAHKSQEHDSIKCNESILHKLGKLIILQSELVKTPPYSREISAGIDLLGNYHNDQYSYDSEVLKLHAVLLEKQSKDPMNPMDSYKPDISARCPLGPIHIEIVVTHDVDKIKHKKVINNGTSMFTIDISGIDPLSDFETIRKYVIYDAPRQWIFHAKAESIIQKTKYDMRGKIDNINLKLKDIVLRHYDINDVIKTNNVTAIPKQTVQSSTPKIITPDPLKFQQQIKKPDTLITNGDELLVLGYKCLDKYDKKHIYNKWINNILYCGIYPKHDDSSVRGGYNIIKVYFYNDITSKIKTLGFPCLIKPNISYEFLSKNMDSIEYILIDYDVVL